MDPTALRVKLNKGAARNGTKLTPAECKLLLRCLPRRRAVAALSLTPSLRS